MDVAATKLLIQVMRKTLEMRKPMSMTAMEMKMGTKPTTTTADSSLLEDALSLISAKSLAEVAEQMVWPP